MTITGIAGKIGSGKSLKQLDYALQQCNRKHKLLVTNFHLNIPAVRKYCVMKGYHWAAWMVAEGLVTVIDTLNNLEALLTYPNSIACLDEAGIFLNAREFAKTPKKLLMDLCQSRKDGIDLIWAAQFDTQVDKQFRQLTQYWIHAAGASVYDRKLKGPRLVWKTYYYFDGESYDMWLDDKKARSSYFRTRFIYAYSTQGGFLNRFDKQLFKCFDSFARLEQQEQFSRSASSRQLCMLPPDYYHERLGTSYEPKNDPLRGSIAPRKLRPIKKTVHQVLTEALM